MEDNILTIVDNSEKYNELSNELEETNRQLEEIKSKDNLMGEDLIYQEKEWLKNRMEQTRMEEETIREELYEKQKILEERRKDQNEFFAQNKQMQLYNKMHDEEQKEQVYALHGITLDKVEGMKEYKNALYQGSQIILSLCDLCLCVAAGFLFGFDTAIFMGCIALFAAQITLLPREHKGILNRSIYSLLSKIFSFIPTVAMVFILVNTKIDVFSDLVIFPLCAAICVVLSVVGSLDYYNRNPYREARKASRAAKNDFAELKKSAAKNVKKNQKLRLKLESKLLKKKESQENKLERIKQKDEKRYLKNKQKEEALSEKLRLKSIQEEERRIKELEINKLREENRTKRKELFDKKVIDYKSRFDSIINKKKSIESETEKDDNNIKEA